MKNIKLVATAALIICISVLCKKNLDQPPIGLVDESKMANRKGVEGLLIGAYSLLDGVGINNQYDYSGWASAGSNWIYGSICGSEAHRGSTLHDDDQIEILELEKFEGTAQNPYMERKWAVVYAGVERANNVLRILKKTTDIADEDRKRITAEARFLRGFYHFEAIKMWNKVP